MTEDAIAARTRALAGALVESGFARLKVREGDLEIELRRAGRTPAPAAMAAAQPAESAEAARAPQPAADMISSDVVGIVRLLRPAVAEGSELDGDRDLAYVETLGIRNPVRSRGRGRVAQVFITDGQPVEYGQPLFAIER